MMHKVKNIKWKSGDSDVAMVSPYGCIFGDTPVFQYMISWEKWRTDCKYLAECEKANYRIEFDSLDKAKEDCQKHYEYVILSCLEDL